MALHHRMTALLCAGMLTAGMAAPAAAATASRQGVTHLQLSENEIRWQQPARVGEGQGDVTVILRRFADSEDYDGFYVFARDSGWQYVVQYTMDEAAPCPDDCYPPYGLPWDDAPGRVWTAPMSYVQAQLRAAELHAAGCDDAAVLKELPCCSCYTKMDVFSIYGEPLTADDLAVLNDLGWSPAVSEQNGIARLQLTLPEDLTEYARCYDVLQVMSALPSQPDFLPGLGCAENVAGYYDPIPLCPIEELPGNLNGDAAIDVKDAVMAARVIAEDTSLTLPADTDPDFNQDGTVDDKDLTELLRLIAGK